MNRKRRILLFIGIVMAIAIIQIMTSCSSYSHRPTINTVTMKERIKKISEAYSMQPYDKKVCTQEHGSRGGQKHIHSKDCIAKIIREIDPLDGPDSILQSLIVGYNFENQRLFIYRADAVNIEYFTE